MRVDLEHAALVLHAKRLAGDLDGHADFKFFVRFDLLEVHMEELVGHRVALDLLEKGQRLDGLVGALELDEHGAAGDGAQEADELGTLDGERLRAGVLPVKNGGNAVGFAQAAGGATARLGAHCDVEFVLLIHDFRSPCRPGIEGRCSGKEGQVIGPDRLKATKTSSGPRFSPVRGKTGIDNVVRRSVFRGLFRPAQAG